MWLQKARRASGGASHATLTAWLQNASYASLCIGSGAAAEPLADARQWHNCSGASCHCGINLLLIVLREIARYFLDIDGNVSPF